jgi:hypothetical protein
MQATKLNREAEKKRVEAYMLSAARESGLPIPTGESASESPDFRFQTDAGLLGIEMCEVLRPASSNNGIVPVEQETLHREIMAAAKSAYYRNSQARLVNVQVYFADARGKRQNRGAMAQALANFVAKNAHRANPFVALGTEWHKPKLEWDELPDGFSSVVIDSQLTDETDDWWSGEVGGYNVLTDTRGQVTEQIRAKDKHVPTYRANLGENASVWLLLYSGVSVARSMTIPACAQEWKFPFSFDRVFWFASLENQFVEIQSQP